MRGRPAFWWICGRRTRSLRHWRVRRFLGLWLMAYGLGAYKTPARACHCVRNGPEARLCRPLIAQLVALPGCHGWEWVALPHGSALHSHACAPSPISCPPRPACIWPVQRGAYPTFVLFLKLRPLHPLWVHHGVHSLHYMQSSSSTGTATQNATHKRISSG
jgi:hypothetical protein